ncbi:MAG: hypothetical protein KA247_09220, partial [Bacteroidetes bacterium]|nr:hypothetical protein [Bacteroidota bacterium]
MRRLFRHILFCSAAAVFFTASAAGQEYSIRSFTTHDGLISNFVTTLKQDSKGYLWIGTDEGFSIFDGSTFRNNRPKRKELWGYINAFFESSVHPGTMWIATNGGGILRYENGNYVQQLVDTLSEANRVNDLFEDANGVLWFTTDHGFYRMKEGLISPIPLSLRHSPFLIQVSAAGSDQLFISSPEGVMIYHTVTGAVRIILTADITGTNGQIFPIDRNGTFAVLTRSSLKLLRDDRVLQTLDLDRGEYGNGTLDASGDLWIGGTECVRRVRFEKGRAQIHSTFDMNNGLPVNDVSGLESDRENNVWFGTMGKGIARLQDPENMRFRFDKLTSRGTSDHRNRIWVPTVDALQALTRNSDRSWHASTIKFSADRRPVALQFVGRDRLWCTTAMGTLTEYRVHSLPNNEIDLTLSTTLDARSSLPKLYPIVLFKDSKDFLWCAKDDGGVIIVDSRSPASVTQKHLSFPGVPRMTMSAFAEGPGGIVVAGGSGTNALLEFKFIEGSYQYQKAYRYDSLISQYGIRSLTFAPDSSLWIGTRYDGIIRKYRDGTVTHYTLQDGLHSLQILSLLSDGKAMWVGMQSGLEYIPDINAPRFILSTELTTSPIYTLGRYTDSTV